MILVISGCICLGVCGFLLYKLMPQDGQPPSPWTDTDMRGTAVALGLLVLMLTGISLVVRGAIS